jgi:dipeptidyl aminopeptidase/acylaminoacyl peptidase
MKHFLLLIFCGCCLSAYPQTGSTYQVPPDAIRDLVLAPPVPDVSFNGSNDYMVQLHRSSLPPLEELAQPEHRIAGLRLNPSNFGSSRQTYYNELRLTQIPSGQSRTIIGLPSDFRGLGLQWSPSQKSFAVQHHGTNAIDLYVIDLADAVAKKVNSRPLNGVIGSAFAWLNDSTILYKAAANTGKSAPVAPLTPAGPVIQENIGKVAAARTYQDLIKTPHDENLFDFYAKAQLVRLDIKTGREEPIGPEAIYRSFSISPDQQYILLSGTVYRISHQLSGNRFKRAAGEKNCRHPFSRRGTNWF